MTAMCEANTQGLVTHCESMWEPGEWKLVGDKEEALEIVRSALPEGKMEPQEGVAVGL